MWCLFAIVLVEFVRYYLGMEIMFSFDYYESFKTNC
jgi:hypothetical protein